MKKATKEAQDLSRYIRVFLDDYAPNQLTTSPHTLKSYDAALTQYVGFLSEVKSVSPEKLCGGCFDAPTIEEWRKWLVKDRNCAPETCNVRLSSLRVFLKYLASREVKYLSLYNDATKIEFLDAVKKQVCGLSRTAVKAILDAPNQRTRTGKRDVTFMLTLYGTAARIDEMLDLKIHQLNLQAPKPYATIISTETTRTLTISCFIQETRGNRGNYRSPPLQKC